MKPNRKRDRQGVETSNTVAAGDSPSPSSRRQKRGTDVVTPSASTPTQPSSPSCNAMLVVGTYHSVMAGLTLQRGKFYLKFSIKHHVGSVSAVCASEKYVASCGTDERLFLFTNKAQQRLSPAVRARMRELGEPLAVRLADLGSLAPPAEARCLCFTPQSQHLLVGCADGRLILYRTRDWGVQHHLTVHERELLTLALHPGSGGALCVTASADRSVAVLDLVKGRLLTKWKYNSHCCNEAQTAETAAGEQNAEKPLAPKQLFRRTAAAREVPVQVLFSPSGAFLVVMALYSFVVYDTAAGFSAVAAYVNERPQPHEELHAACFLSESVLVLGNEAGKLMVASITPAADKRTITLQEVPLSYPAELEQTVAALPPKPDAQRECRQKNPLRNISRIKALSAVEDMVPHQQSKKSKTQTATATQKMEQRTLFSLDSSGVVLALRSTVHANGDADAAGVSLSYLTSANCQGRTTCLSALAL